MRILTFDIEDWYHFLEHRSTRTAEQWATFEPRVVQNTSRILNFLDKNNQKATFFIIGWIADRHPSVVRDIAAAGHQIGLHSYGHQLIWQQKDEEFRQDILRNTGILEDQLGKKVEIYRAPGFSITKHNTRAFEVLAFAGITTDASIFPALRAHGGMPSFPYNEPCIVESGGIRIKEFPVNYNHIAGFRTVLSGGGYFRFWPYPLIHRLIAHSPYVMTYFHPRDFDRDQPILHDLGPYRRFRAYYGLHHSLDKLGKLINDFHFTDLATADGSINWSTAPVVKF
ncbi:MAG TPA: polysaccharide deacetylase family protein [Bacteroidales bacterium]|nr:polysaccharide deacetylase family protein [Bacteroidales bacterium]